MNGTAHRERAAPYLFRHSRLRVTCASGLASQAAGAKVLLIGMHIPPNYGPDYTEAFHGMFAELSEAHDTALLPFLLEPIATDREAFLPDNLHPTAEAQPRLLEHVWPQLERLMAGIGD